MVKPIIRDVMFLSRKSEEATLPPTEGSGEPAPALKRFKTSRRRSFISEQDKQVITDLHETLAAHRERCVGMAANMIGSRKRIIIVSLGFTDMVMMNPVIVSKSEPYETEEGCLSLDGVRKTRRYGRITVRYQDENFKSHTEEYRGQIAQIIQLCPRPKGAGSPRRL